MVHKLLMKIHIFLTGWRFAQAVERNNRAAEGLDATVREVLKR